jgi:hypothetical protein
VSWWLDAGLTLPHLKIFCFTDDLKASDLDSMTDYPNDTTASRSCPKVIFGTSSVKVSAPAVMYTLLLGR